jgi:hypothetical protein
VRQLATVGPARPLVGSAQPAAAVGERWLDSFLGFVRVDQTARPEPRHDFWQAGTGDREAALAATENTGEAEHFLTHVPGAMHHDRPGEGVAVARVESLETDRVAMGTYIKGPRSIGSGGGRIRTRFVGEALKPSGTGGVRTPSMRHQMRLHAAVGELHQVEPRCTRRKGEVGEADRVSVGDAVVMSLQSIERPPQQSRRYRADATFRLPESRPNACRRSSQAGYREPEKRTTGKYQDVELRHR